VSRKVTTKDLLRCFKIVRQNGIQGDDLFTALAKCVREQAWVKADLRKAVEEGR